jgi:predicted kinase
MKLIVCQGLPGSGKSFWAKEMMAAKPDFYRRINRDSLRLMLDEGTWGKDREKFIRCAEIMLAEMYLKTKHAVIIDDTNLSQSAMRMWLEFAAAHEIKLEIKDFTDVPLETCIKRDQHRHPRVGKKVIMRMWRDHLAPKVEPPIYDARLPVARIFDIDGTLALTDGRRSPYNTELCEGDSVNEPVRELLNSIRQPRCIILCSGREDRFRPHTERWLRANEIEYNHLFMRATGDTRRDDIVKKEIYENNIRGKFWIAWVVDDRNRVVQAWRSLGLTVFQCADGDF